MQIGMVGLGRMGANMVQRLLDGGHAVSAFDRSADAVKQSAAAGATGCDSLAALVQSLAAPRAVWVMVPSGAPTRDTIASLGESLQRGDIVIDGGNSYWKDGQAQAKDLAAKGIALIDAGTSGGIWGLKAGYCLMVGGDAAACKRMEPVFLTLAPKDGYLYVGEAGAGHFVKMVHNGIEYAMLQAYGEGFEIIKASEFGAGLDFGKISHLWNQGSVIRSWLLELAELAFKADPGLEKIAGYVDDTGEGRWTVQDSIDLAVPAPTIALSLMMRFRSRQPDSFSAKVIAALRNEFGGHAVKPEPAASASGKAN
ncbi:MAG TPA: decarboxylating 6-phosphogluconate dehydrogenase [Candidatus Eremiobacteraceae bacterium]|nr:decarboxylating 6-phosphogluconate dehydrogenase [Candidatus Eremiobacteraceae bacterium]